MIRACLLAACLAASAAHAGDCAVRVNRVAHEGKAAEAYAPYGGKNPTAQMVPLSSADACKALAVKMCVNDRPAVVKAKDVKAKYDGDDLNGGADVCPAAQASR